MGKMTFQKRIFWRLYLFLPAEMIRIGFETVSLGVPMAMATQAVDANLLELIDAMLFLINIGELRLRRVNFNRISLRWKGIFRLMSRI